MIRGMWTADKMTELRKKVDIRKINMDYSVFDPKTVQECDDIFKNGMMNNELSIQSQKRSHYCSTEKSAWSLSKPRATIATPKNSNQIKAMFVRRGSLRIKESSPSTKALTLATNQGTKSLI